MNKYVLIIAIFIVGLLMQSCVPTLSNEGRDGLTMETAWKVKSMREQYQFVADKCHKCMPVSQGLSADSSGNPVDVMTFKKPNGEEITYYFDISNYFGKY